MQEIRAINFGHIIFDKKPFFCSKQISISGHSAKMLSSAGGAYYSRIIKALSIVIFEKNPQ